MTKWFSEGVRPAQLDCATRGHVVRDRADSALRALAAGRHLVRRFSATQLRWHTDHRSMFRIIEFSCRHESTR